MSVRETPMTLTRLAVDLHLAIGEVLNSQEWTAGEKFIVKWQWHCCGDFHRELAELMCRADEDNLARLALGFPEEVAGFRAWRFGDLGKRLSNVGLE